MPKTRVQKEEIVIQLKEKLAGAKSVVFADYRGLTMKQLSQLRDKLREVDSEFTVTKNTLLTLALPTSTSSLHLEGPIATLLAYGDEISPIKLLVKALKEAGIGKIKSGFLGSPADGEPLDEARVNQLAELPTKDELRGQTVAVLVAPLQGMVGVLQANLRNLVYALGQIRLQKGGV